MFTSRFAIVFFSLMLLFVCMSASATAQFAPAPAISGPWQNPVNIVLEENAGSVLVKAHTAECVPLYEVTGTLEREIALNVWVSETAAGDLQLGSLSSAAKSARVASVIKRQDAKLPDGNYRLKIAQRYIGGDNRCVVGTSDRPFTHTEIAHLRVGNTARMMGEPEIGSFNSTTVSTGTIRFSAKFATRTRVTAYQENGLDSVTAVQGDYVAGDVTVELPVPSGFRPGPIKLHILSLVEPGNSFSRTLN